MTGNEVSFRELYFGMQISRRSQAPTLADVCDDIQLMAATAMSILDKVVIYSHAQSYTVSHIQSGAIFWAQRNYNRQLGK